MWSGFFRRWIQIRIRSKMDRIRQYWENRCSYIVITVWYQYTFMLAIDKSTAVRHRNYNVHVQFFILQISSGTRTSRNNYHVWCLIPNCTHILYIHAGAYPSSAMHAYDCVIFWFFTRLKIGGTGLWKTTSTVWYLYCMRANFWNFCNAALARLKAVFLNRSLEK
jgi:hypothetical protein